MKLRARFTYLLIVAAAMLFLGAPVGSAYADGCFLCKPGSSEACKHYCHYRGEDNWENRQKCQNAGCDIGGTASCPSAANYKVCYVENGQILDYLAFRYGLNWNASDDRFMAQ